MHFRFKFYFTFILFSILSFLLIPSVLVKAADFSNSQEIETDAKVNKKAVKKLREMTPEKINAIDKKLAEALILYYDRKFGLALPIFKEIADQVETMDIEVDPKSRTIFS